MALIDNKNYQSVTIQRGIQGKTQGKRGHKSNINQLYSTIVGAPIPDPPQKLCTKYYVKFTKSIFSHQTSFIETSLW